MPHHVCIALILVLASPALAEEPNQTDDAGPQFAPGQTVAVDLPGVGGDRFIVYTPSDYDPQRPHPVIVCYHGLNGDPTVEPFRTNLEGKAYIIVGMEYFERGLVKRTWDEKRRYNQREFDAARRALEHLNTRLHLDPALRFIGGVSKGGWQSSSYFEANPDFWAGMLIIAAGRDMPEKDLARLSLRDKPIYIGVGETDTNNLRGHTAATQYESRGAQVTIEDYAGLGHADKPDSQVMRQFLLEHGPLKSLRALAGRAAKAEESGKLGEALTDYLRAAGGLSWHEEGIAAQQHADRLASAAARQLADARAAIEAAQYVEGFGALHGLARQYAGSSAADEAQALIAQLKSDPQLTARMEQAETDARADALEQAARAAEADEDWAAALRAYARYVETFTAATRFGEVKAHHDRLLVDKDIVRKAQDQDAARDCQEWLSMADNYLKASRADLAAQYLQKVVDTYPDSSFADTAREKLKAAR